METTFRKYGRVIEITEVEKTTRPRQIRVRPTRTDAHVHRPRRPDNLRRTKRICMRRVYAALEEFGRPLLVTLTFKGDASDASYANDSLRTFQMRLRDTFPNAHSIFIPELSPKGRIHFHGLLFNVPLHLGDTKKGRRVISMGTERTTRQLANLWGEGYVDATATDGSGRLANYVSKYITKGAGHVMFSAMRLLRISHGFPKETVIRGEFAEMIAKSYATRTALVTWEGQNMFLGKITKRIYNTDIP